MYWICRTCIACIFWFGLEKVVKNKTPKKVQPGSDPPCSANVLTFRNIFLRAPLSWPDCFFFSFFFFFFFFRGIIQSSLPNKTWHSANIDNFLVHSHTIESLLHYLRIIEAEKIYPEATFLCHIYQSIQKSEKYYTVTLCIALYFVTRCAAPSDKIQCNTGNITRGVAECNISRYWTRKASRVKYSKHPEGLQRPLMAPAQGMSSLSMVTVFYFEVLWIAKVYIPCTCRNYQIFGILKMSILKARKARRHDLT